MEFEAIINSPQYKAVLDFLSSVGFSSGNIFSKWTLIQIAILVGAFFFARTLTRLCQEPINNQLRKIEGQRKLLRFLVIFHRRSYWLMVSIQLWLSYLVLRYATWPSNSYLIRILAGLVTTWFFISVFSRLIKNRFVSRSVSIMAWTLTALYIVGLLPEAREALDGVAVNLGTARLSLLTILQSVVLLAVLIWLAGVISQFLGNAISGNDDLSPSVKVLLTKIIRFCFLATAIFISLGAVGIDFTALAVFSGAVGIGIGLGLQKIVSNFISGIILLLDKSIKPGDVIEIETVSGSTYGWVQRARK